MHIVHVCRQFAPGVGGLEEFIDKLSQEQVRSGHVVRVVTLDRIFDDPADTTLPHRDQRGTVEVHRVPFVGSKRYPIAPGVLRHLGKADVVHVHGVDFLSDFLAATSWLHRKPLVLSTHGGFFHTGFAATAKRVFFAMITRLALTRYCAVIASSLQDEALFKQIAPTRVVTVEDAVDVGRFAGRAACNAKCMIYFGRWAPNKGIDRAIAWFAAVRRHDPAWRMIVAGKPMGVSAEELSSAACRNGVTDAIEFHVSPTDDELGRLIARCSVYVCASSYEGFGMAAVEAAAAGLYPVLSGIPPFQRIVERLGFGTLTEFDPDADDFATVLIDLQTGPLRDAADTNTLATFAWPRASRDIDAIYGSVLGLEQRRIGPVAVAVMTPAEALATAHAAIDAGQGGVITFCNAHTVNTARRSPALRRSMDRALVLNDGVGVEIASRLLYSRPFPANLNGTDFIPALLASRALPTRVFLLGGKPGVAERAGGELASRYANVRIAGTEHGFVSREGQDAVLDRIRQADPDVILLGLGQPLQEIWADRHGSQLDAVLICVGALLDFTAGEVTRAPSWVRRLSAEWVYRLVLEPRRMWRRYLVGNVVFLSGVLHQKLNCRRGISSALHWASRDLRSANAIVGSRGACAISPHNAFDGFRPNRDGRDGRSPADQHTQPPVRTASSRAASPAQASDPSAQPERAQMQRGHR